MQNKPYFFFLETGVPKRGEGGGGVRHLGKIPKKSRFLGGWRPLEISQHDALTDVAATLVTHIFLWRKHILVKGIKI